MSTQNHSDLPKEIQESLEAGRIEESNLTTIRYIIEKHGIEDGLVILKYFEERNSIKPYFENLGTGFKFNQFTFHKDLPKIEKAKILVALKEAMTIVEFDFRKERADANE